MDSRIIRVFEYDKLFYDKPDSRFEKKHWEQLSRYNEQNQNRYYTILGRGVQFSNYVGVIQIGNLTIEILPKVEKLSKETNNKNEKESRKKCWHDILLEMLETCKNVPVNSVKKAKLNLKSSSFLDIYLRLFLNNIQTLIHQGLIKKYKKTETNANALKGKLLMNKHIIKNTIHKEKFYVEYTILSKDNIYNQLLLKALKIIPLITPTLRSDAKSLIAKFPELQDIQVTKDTFDRIRYDRKTEPYKDALLIAKMIILNYRPDIKGGDQNVIAILFDMNVLWQEYVVRRMQTHTKKLGLCMRSQEKAKFWRKTVPNSRSRYIKPDILITNSNNKKVVIDTKWKIPSGLEPSIEDLKQMLIYNLYWECDQSILLYPGEDDRLDGDYHRFPINTNVEAMGSRCVAIRANVLKNEKLDKEFCLELLNSIAQL